MISRFINRFKKDDLDEQRSFQRKVHAIVSKVYPERIFELSDDPATIECDGVIYGLTNLHAKFLLSGQTDAELDELTVEIFNGMESRIAAVDKDIPWEVALSHLMPQLMPDAFIQMAPIELVHQPFIDGVTLGFVVDAEKSYHYVNVEMRRKWGVDLDTVRSVAFENLKQRSEGIEMTAFPGDNAFFIINTMDGFDAVRIVLPQMKEVISEHVGSPFFAAVPNREFLICWSAAGDQEFQEQMRQQVSSDFDEQPYPLSRSAFEVLANGEIREILDAMDARAANPELN
ncbi:MAG: DUF1444 family protein [Chloracidobacterium sp.]|nr:DUF1444 family protein [Chloracidobacterium sp.]